jgi:uncharacterized protein YndB with AHSA1/START domain
MNDAPDSTMAERHLEITRIFDAPRDLVWTCWTDPEHFAAWFGPENFHTPLESVVIDLRPGGIFKSTMVDPDGNEHPGNGTFEEVTPKDRLIFSEKDIDHPMMESQYTIVSFKDLGDGRTELHIDVTIVCVAELIPMAESGWNSTFDKLAVVLAGG